MGFLSKKPSLINLIFGIFIFSIQSIQLDAFFLFTEQQNPGVDAVLREVDEYLSRGLEIKSGDENGVSGQFLKRLGFDILISTSRQINSGLVESTEQSLLFQLIDRVYDKKLSDPEFVVLLGISTLFTDDLAGIVAAKKDSARNYLSHMVMMRREVFSGLTAALNAIPDEKLDNEYAATYRTFLIFNPKHLSIQISELIGFGTKKLAEINLDYGPTDLTSKKKVLEIKAYLQAFGYDVDKKSDFLLSSPFVTFNYGRLVGAFKWLETQGDTSGILNPEKILSKLTSLQLFPVKENSSFNEFLIISSDSSSAAPWTGNFDHGKILDEIHNLDLTDPDLASFKLNEFQERLIKILCANISLRNDQRRDIAANILDKIYEFKSSVGAIIDFGIPIAGKQALAERKAAIDSMQAQHASLMAIAKKQKLSASGLALLKQQKQQIEELQKSHQALLLELRNGAIEANSDKMAEIAFLIVNLNYWIDVFRRVATELLMDNLKFAFEAKFGDFWQFWRDPSRILPKERRTPQEDLFFQKRANAQLLLSSAAQFEKILAQQMKKLLAILDGAHAQDLMSVVSAGNQDFVINELWAIFASLSDQTLNSFIAENFQASRDQNKDKLDKIIEFFRGEVGDADLAGSLNFLFAFNQTAGQKTINADMISEIALRVKNSRRLCQEHIITFQNVAQQKKAAFKSVSQGARSGLIGQGNFDQNIYYDKDGRRLVVNEAYGGKAMLSGLSKQADRDAQAKSKEAKKYKDASIADAYTSMGGFGAVGGGLLVTGIGIAAASGPAAPIALPVTAGAIGLGVGVAAGGKAAYDAHKGARAEAKADQFYGISEGLRSGTQEEDSGDEAESLGGDEEADESLSAAAEDEEIDAPEPLIPSSLPFASSSDLTRERAADRNARPSPSLSSDPSAIRSQVRPSTPFSAPSSSRVTFSSRPTALSTRSFVPQPPVRSPAVTSSRPQAQTSQFYQEPSFEPPLTSRSAFVEPSSSLASRVQRVKPSVASQRQASSGFSSRQVSSSMSTTRPYDQFDPLLYQRPFDP